MSGPVDLDIFRICYYIDNKTSNGFDVYLVKNGIKDDESCVQALADTKTKVVMLLGPDTNNCVRIVSAQMQLEMWDVFHQSFVDLDIFRICYYIDNKISNDFDAYLVKNGVEDNESRLWAPAGKKTKVSMLLGPDTNNCARIVSSQMQLEMWNVFHQSFVGEHCINIVHKS
ncbi:hypothetical protein V6N11_067641 [Hibiscus sabdariffa]|uniref:Uncharacterized protein n=1 Tax=Hibiscus sabdariffa TaxID=183260 RepID=A0ABR2SS90_9ROSI